MAGSANIEIDDRKPLSIEAELYLNKYLERYNTGKKDSGEQNIKISQVLGSVAFLYERIRNAVEYKGEHLLKRSAIERFLKRQIWERKNVSAKDLTDSIVRELTWARYLTNESISPKKIVAIVNTLEKYLEIFKFISLSSFQAKKKVWYRDWFVKIASSEIEEILDDNIYYSELLADAVFSWFKKNFEWKDVSFISEEESDIQIYLAVQRCVARFDNAGLAYRVLKLYKPEWTQLPDKNIEVSFNELTKLADDIQSKLESKIQPKIYKFVQKQSAAFLVFHEFVDQAPDKAYKIINNPALLEKKVEKICLTRYAQIQKKINTGIRRSIIYIFLTKVLLAFVIEFPYEYFILKGFNITGIIINTLFPPMLMFFVGISIKKPGSDNTKRIIQKIKSFVYLQEVEAKIEFSVKPKKAAGFIYQVFSIFYLFLFILTFGGITVLLTILDFNIVGIGVFFVFLSLVLLFAYRVKYTASELSVKETSEGFLAHLFTNITLPLLNLGFWLSEGFKQVNILTIFMDFLIETPLKRIIKVFEEWSGFIKEKKEDVVEVPN